MIDHLSRALDGAGSLRTVPPTTVLRRWRGRADSAAALALGRRTGAGLVVYGQVLRSGQDSVRVRSKGGRRPKGFGRGRSAGCGLG